MKAETEALKKMEIWKLAIFPDHKKAIRTKWLHDSMRDGQGVDV